MVLGKCLSTKLPSNWSGILPMSLKETQQNDFRVHSFWVDSRSGPLKIFTGPLKIVKGQAKSSKQKKKTESKIILKKENDRKRLGPSDSTTFISAHPSGQRLGTPTVGLNTMALAIEGDTSTKPGKKKHEAGMEKKN